MSIQDLKRLKPRLERFCRKFDDCIKDPRTRKHLRTYVNGQLSDLPRKSIEPMALRMGTPVRTLQEFVEIHRWDDAAAAGRLRQLVAQDHADENAIGLIDETSFSKKGQKTAGVQRQHCGAKGKVDNCVVTVHLGYASGDFHVPIDGDLFLPEKTWAFDRERCKEAKIPDDVTYRPKWKIALDLLERSRADGVKLRWLTADEAYGKVMEFRDRVEAMGLLYVMEIPSNLVGWTKFPKIERAGTRLSSGHILEHHRLAKGAKRARPVSQLWKRGGPAWQLWRVKETEKGPSVWEVRETTFYPNVQGYPGEPLRLLIAREVLTGEVKYFLSNAPAEVPLGEVIYVAFSRWRIERIFEDGKGRLGFDHFEVRHYRPLIRHLILTMISFYFLAEQTEWFREKKLCLDPLSTPASDRAATRSEPLAA